MRRRHLIALGIASVPVCARAQPPPRPVTIGFLNPSSPDLDRAWHAAFVKRLGELGRVEGRNLTIEYRSARGSVDRAREIAEEFARLPVDLILASGDAQVLAAKRVTPSLPIVVAASADPVGNGLVASLARPGGNVTGLSLALTDTAGKRLELLRELVPGLRRLAVLGNFSNRSVTLELEAVQTAAASGQEIIRLDIRRNEDIVPAVESLKGRVEAVYVCIDPLVNINAARINALCLAAGLPVMHSFQDNARASGLISYGPDRVAMFRRAAEIADKILAGSNPGDIPVEQPTLFALVVNLRTARELGVGFPESILARADEVID